MTSRNAFRLATTAVLIAVLGACAGDSNDPADSVKKDSTTTVKTVGTTRQYASAVAEEAPELRQAAATVENGCNFDGECTTLAGITSISLGLKGQIIATNLKLVQGRDYSLEKVPEEVRDLVGETIVAGEALYAASKALPNCTVASDECLRRIVALRGATSDMVQKLDAWKPYGA